MSVQSRRTIEEAIDPDAWYPASFLARRWRIHQVTVFKWQSRGIIPRAKKVGPNTSRWLGRVILEHEQALADAGNA